MRRVINDQPAFLLRRFPYRERGSLLDLLTREYGVVRLVYHQRRDRARQQSVKPQLCVPLSIGWREGRKDSNLANLSQVNVLPDSRASLAQLARLLLPVSYMNELVLSFFKPRDPHPALYDCYRLAISGLVEMSAEAVLRFFECHLLNAAGYSMLDRSGSAGHQHQSADALKRPSDELSPAAERWLTDCSALAYRLEQGLNPQQRLTVLSALHREFDRLNSEERFSLRRCLQGQLNLQLNGLSLISRQIARQVQEILVPDQGP